MRAGVITGQGRFELIDVDDPSPRPGEVVVAIDRCGICGSEVHAYQEGWPYSPGICGHEWTGLVVALGDGVDGIGTDLRVVGAQAPGCGACRECRADLPNYCRVARSRYSGRMSPSSGGFAPFLTLDANRVVPVPDGVDAEQAALVEPASVALHAVRRSRLEIGDVTCVVGCGPIGLMVIQCARVAGAGTIIAVEPDDARRDLAVELGADLAVAPGAELRAAVDQHTDGLRADIAFDCAGIPATLQQSVDMVRLGGSVCVVGVTGAEATIQPMRWMMKEVSVDTSLQFTLDEMAIAAELIARGRVRTRELVAATIGLDELPATIDDLATRRLEAIKVLVDPSKG